MENTFKKSVKSLAENYKLAIEKCLETDTPQTVDVPGVNQSDSLFVPYFDKHKTVEQKIQEEKLIYELMNKMDERVKDRSNRSDISNLYDLYLVDDEGDVRHKPVKSIEDSINKWDPYLFGCETKEEATCLAQLLENCSLYFNGTSNLTFSKFVGLAREGWMNSRLRKYVNIQQLVGPTGLAFYIRDEEDHLKLDSEAIVAETYPYNFHIKDEELTPDLFTLYAKKLSDGIDSHILKNLPKNFNAEIITEKDRLRPPFFLPYVILGTYVLADGNIQCYFRAGWYNGKE